MLTYNPYTLYVNKNIYHYNVMPIRSINVDSTYQRMVHKLFLDMIRKTMEEYIDDMIVKSKVGMHDMYGWGPITYN